MVTHAYSPSYCGGWGGRITWTWQVEVAVSWDCATIIQPGQQSKTVSQKKRKRIPGYMKLLWLKTMYYVHDIFNFVTIINLPCHPQHITEINTDSSQLSIFLITSSLVLKKLKITTQKCKVLGQAQSLTTVTQHFERQWQNKHLSPGVWDQPGQHGKTPSL